MSYTPEEYSLLRTLEREGIEYAIKIDGKMYAAVELMGYMFDSVPDDVVIIVKEEIEGCQGDMSLIH